MYENYYEDEKKLIKLVHQSVKMVVEYTRTNTHTGLTQTFWKTYKYFN